jgi:hypothetical protein
VSVIVGVNVGLLDGEWEQDNVGAVVGVIDGVND